MANEKDSCKAKLTLANYATTEDAEIVKELNNFTVTDIEKAGKGAGLVFFPPKDAILEFPATKKDAKLDVDYFETSKGKKVPILYGRVHYCGTWQWFPLAVFRRVPTDEYTYVDKDGHVITVNEKEKFFTDYDLGRELAEVRKSDLDVYTTLVGNKYKVAEVFMGHTSAFKDGEPVKGEYKLIYCFKLESV